MQIYIHRQPGLILLLLVPAALLLAVYLVDRFAPAAAGPGMAVALVVLVLVVALFWSLTVEVTSDHVRVWFGFGLIQKTFPIQEIRAVRPVRNRWYYGWGIRRTPHGWMFNVSGLDAVELELASGKRFRIGTDQPEQLDAAIEQALERAG